VLWSVIMHPRLREAAMAAGYGAAIGGRPDWAGKGAQRLNFSTTDRLMAAVGLCAWFVSCW